MGKIHVLLKKEELELEKINNEKIVVVFDILLATSTITTLLAHGANEVIPVLNFEEAISEEKQRNDENILKVGEYRGKPIDGFLYPYPRSLKEQVNGKTIILSTTNGTVAIKKAARAKKIYAASLLNAKAVAEKILDTYAGETILLVCAGSFGRFNIEDFYGAGFFIECLQQLHKNWELTDAALTAHLIFKNNIHQGNVILKKSRVGQKIIDLGFEHEIDFIAQKNRYDVVPVLSEKVSLVT
ncbi:2-phosphosulfolactate phosphatase [Pallidibacillus pasinlerensis]|uniref:Probable 2-phosphosulfolactate phosphatase n=1 Tax=Pallidibacillus pasinlerensis TaxID=2703818 RepID=A0ABX0A401_9BACI|nr:2-phosphosulfolactate phosphatase [Pallidibacillus pasinlerensis]NCU16980.1 2-phosphosulfolactate phosphatase [Pallidibacillus pasinlerensis]